MAEYQEFKKRMQHLQEAHDAMLKENIELKQVNKEQYIRVKTLKGQV